MVQDNRKPASQLMNTSRKTAAETPSLSPVRQSFSVQKSLNSLEKIVAGYEQAALHLREAISLIRDAKTESRASRLHLLALSTIGSNVREFKPETPLEPGLDCVSTVKAAQAYISVVGRPVGNFELLQVLEKAGVNVPAKPAELKWLLSRSRLLVYVRNYGWVTREILGNIEKSRRESIRNASVRSREARLPNEQDAS